MSLRTPLGRVIGLGSAKQGTDHWWAQRLTAVALVPLTLWFAAALLFGGGFDYATLAEWLSRPLNAVLCILLALTLVYHSKLGVEVIVEDYLHGAAKVVTLVVAQFIHFALGVAAVFAILKHSFG